MSKLFIIAASSGAGKTTVVNALLKMPSMSDCLKRIITYTSRAARSDEIDGIDYHFVTTQDFEQKIKEGFFLEWSKAYGNYYGVSSSFLSDLKRGIACVAIVDQNGAKTLKARLPNSVAIWILTPDIGLLKQRLKARGKNSESDIMQRVFLAQQEQQEIEKSADYQYYLTNDILEKAVSRLESIVKQELSAYLEEPPHDLLQKK